MTPTAEKEKRWWRYAKKRQLICPVKHHIPTTSDFPESGFLRCNRWIEHEKRECGKWIFLYAIRGGGCVIAEVGEKEMREMEDLLTPSSMLEYLEIWPPFIV